MVGSFLISLSIDPDDTCDFSRIRTLRECTSHSRSPNRASVAQAAVRFCWPQGLLPSRSFYRQKHMVGIEYIETSSLCYSRFMSYGHACFSRSRGILHCLIWKGAGFVASIDSSQGEHNRFDIWKQRRLSKSCMKPGFNRVSNNNF